MIGWGQGKMSMDEINEVIDYAGTFGIEVIPSLELCGHMEKILSLEPYSEYSEMGGVLDGDRRECQKFVSELLEEALQFFPSEYIHIGGDETWFLGRGKSLNRYRVFKGPEIYVRLHKMLIEKVLSCGKIPILWGDMLLGGYVDKGVSEVWREVIDERIWEKCIIANWDYAPSREESFREKIETMEKRGLTQWVSPGLHDANKFYPNIESAEQNVTSFLQAGRGTNGFLVTSWGDDGRESLYSHILPLLFIPRALWNKSSWEKEWEEVSRESKGIISARKLFGNKVLSTTHKMFLYSNPYLRKYDGNFEKVKDDYEKAISVEVSLPEELAMIKELYTLCHQKYTGGVPPQRYISLAKRYRDVWLKERKPYGVERIFGRLWYTAGLTECSLPQMSRDAAAGSKFEHIVEPNHG
ncbi:MAG TPA: beta-N-acetylhexosaminidase [Candidatus Omnitrophica bacterium]|nr:beta-N-acetylhexosaminidase [Candidatus Omnitrophota bacterium]